MDFPGRSTGVGCHCLLRLQFLGRTKDQSMHSLKHILITECSRKFETFTHMPHLRSARAGLQILDLSNPKFLLLFIHNAYEPENFGEMKTTHRMQEESLIKNSLYELKNLSKLPTLCKASFFSTVREGGDKVSYCFSRQPSSKCRYYSLVRTMLAVFSQKDLVDLQPVISWLANPVGMGHSYKPQVAPG